MCIVKNCMAILTQQVSRIHAVTVSCIIYSWITFLFTTHPSNNSYLTWLKDLRSHKMKSCPVICLSLSSWLNRSQNHVHMFHYQYISNLERLNWARYTWLSGELAGNTIARCQPVNAWQSTVKLPAITYADHLPKCH